MTHSVAAAGQPSGARPAISLVVVNARLWTGRAARPWADALAVRGESLAAVGSSAEIRKLAGSAARVVDAAGGLLVPGADGGAYSRYSRNSGTGAVAAVGAGGPVLVAGGPADFTLLDVGLAGGIARTPPEGAPPEPRVVLVVAGGVVLLADASGPP